MLDESPEEFEERLREKWSGSGPESGDPFGIGEEQARDPEEIEDEFEEDVEHYAEKLDDVPPERREELLGWGAAYIMVQLQFSEGIIRELKRQGAMPEQNYGEAVLQLEVATRCVMLLLSGLPDEIDARKVLQTMALLRSVLGSAP